MSKAELIDAIAGHADLTKTDASKALAAFCAAITGALAKGENRGPGRFRIVRCEGS